MVRVPVEPDGVHEALREFNHFVVWKAIPKEDGEGFTKVPYNSHTGHKASSTDSRTWTSFEEAVASYVQGEWDGMGFVFSSGDPFTGIDLDKCRNPQTGEIAQWAKEWIDRFDGYVEISPSGNGIHIIIKGKSLHNGKGTVNGKQVEIYSTERFFTLTGVRP